MDAYNTPPLGLQAPRVYRFPGKIICIAYVIAVGSVIMCMILFALFISRYLGVSRTATNGQPGHTSVVTYEPKTDAPAVHIQPAASYTDPCQRGGFGQEIPCDATSGEDNGVMYTLTLPLSTWHATALFLVACVIFLAWTNFRDKREGHRLRHKREETHSGQQ